MSRTLVSTAVVITSLLFAFGCSGAARVSSIANQVTPPQSFLAALPGLDGLKIPRHTSASSRTWRVSGSDYLPGFASAKVSPEGSSAVFDPLSVGGNAGLNGAAYAIYNVDATGYSRDQVVTYGTDDSASSAQQMWLAAADWTQGRWIWRPFEEDGSSSFDFAGLIRDNQVTLAVLCIGVDQRQLDYLQLGTRDSWTHSFGGAGLDESGAVVIGEDDNVYVCGFSESFSTWPACLVVKYTRLGEFQWARLVALPDEGLAAGTDSQYYGFSPCGGDGIAAAACVDTNPAAADGVYEDALLFRLSASGVLLWQKRWAVDGQCTSPRIAGFSNGSVSLFVEDNSEFLNSTNEAWETVHLHLGSDGSVVQNSALRAGDPPTRINTVDARLFRTSVSDVYSLYNDGSVGGTNNYGGLRINADGSLGAYPLEQPGVPTGSSDYLQVRNHIQAGISSGIFSERIGSPAGQTQQRVWGRVFWSTGCERCYNSACSDAGCLAFCAGSEDGLGLMRPILVAYNLESGEYVSSWVYDSPGGATGIDIDSYGNVYAAIAAPGNLFGDQITVSGSPAIWTPLTAEQVTNNEGQLVSLGNGVDQNASQAAYAGAVTPGTAVLTIPDGAVQDADAGGGDFLVSKRDVTSFWQ